MKKLCCSAFRHLGMEVLRPKRCPKDDSCLFTHLFSLNLFPHILQKIVVRYGNAVTNHRCDQIATETKLNLLETKKKNNSFLVSYYRVRVR